MSEEESQHLARIRRAVAVVEGRMRLGRAMRALPPLLTAGLAVAAGTLAVRKTLPAVLSEHRAGQILIGAGVFVLAALVVALIRRLPPRAGSMALDRAHNLADRLTNALSFAALPKAERSPLMEVAIEDACEHTKTLAPSKAAPLPFSRDLLVPLGVGAGVVLIAMLEIRTVHQEPPPRLIEALQMSPDDIELFKDAAKDLALKDQSPEVKSAVDRFNQLIEDIAQKRLDRTEAFRQMEAIERDLLKGEEADQKQLEDALKETALDLKKSDLAKPLGESLEKKDFDKAKKDLKDLADRLKSKKKPDKAELDRLRKALAEAAARRKEALAAINEKRAEMEEELLKKKRSPKDPDAGAPDPKEEELLKKKERELERLDREAEQKERVGRQLDKLDRDLAKAAEDLMKDMGASAEDLEQAAEDINRMQQEEMSDKEKEELRQRLEELRELLRQQGQGGKQRMARMMKFGKRARGSGQKGEKGDPGEQGKGEQGEGDDGEGDEKGQEGQGKDGENGKGGQKPGGQQWGIGPGGKKILIPGMGQGQSPGQGQGDGQGRDGQGQGQDSPGGGPGKGIGSSHDGDVKGKATDPKMGTEDVQAQGIDSKQGPSNSEVILGAAEKGFKGGSYKKVYTEYHTVAEQQVNKDEIPDGYRFYVRRYFQLIRPRE